MPKAIQYILANPNISVPMNKKNVRISEFVPISEITLIQWGIITISIMINLTRILKLIERYNITNVDSKHTGE